MLHEVNKCDLKSCSLCRGCLKEWLPALDLHRKTFEFRKGDTLFEEGGEVKGIWFLISGIVKVHKKWGDDKSLIIRFVKPGDIFGHRALQEKLYPIAATALEPVTACLVEPDFFLSTLKVNHDYAYNLLLFMADELQESERRMRNLAHMPVKQRIAYCLLKLAEKFGLEENGTMKFAISRQDPAAYAGTIYETAFRAMNELVETQLVEIEQKRIVIKDIHALEQMLEH